MSIGKSKGLWDISNRPSTQTKLKILRKYFDIWLTIWNNQDWASNDWYVIDLFAGKGNYTDKNKIVSGSPLIFLETIADKQRKLKDGVKIKLVFVEKDTRNFECLKKNITAFLRENLSINNVIDVMLFKEDCNNAINEIVGEIKNARKNPLFVLIDPTGLQPQKVTVQEIVKLKNPKDILFNYILEGVRRTSGIAKKSHLGCVLNMKEIKTLTTLKKFIGEDVNVINKNDRKILEDYVDSLFTSRDLRVVAYDMPYPDREDILYYLLFASRKPQITDIVKNIYAEQKESSSGLSLFGRKFYKDTIFTVSPKMRGIKRKSLLYKTGVEYGSWTINHVEGCMHGCKFPCYAYMMSKKFGRIRDYDEWRKPKIVVNALELLEKELFKYKGQFDFVHLSFMTDPFMYDSDKRKLVPRVKELTLKIIESLNREGIKVTTLTKGFYPDEILDNKKFLKDNEYGATLVSLNNKFKKQFEPFSASYEKRINSLKKLHNVGLRTWVSIEPYPTPNLDETAGNIEFLLDNIGFVDKIIFGKLNYNIMSSKFSENGEFYKAVAQKVINFCKKNRIAYHVKSGTPCSEEKTKIIFKDTQ